MAKVTSKLQVTVPKALAIQLGIQPGDEVDWAVSGDSFHVTPAKQRRHVLDLDTRLRLFHEATDRQRRREQVAPVKPTGGDRGWSREDLYDRRRTR
ncbi:MAG: AbrB/MazE/SpoVT family DNA-binding domain-containing protein [Gammaproteobacteria bacterium]|nr:AbrB/MazE/SpoVT family DNA-binding domain-containing protein [Gammaproteobacteria bacterium]